MDFSEAARRFVDLQAQRKRGMLTESQFRAAVDQLRVQDSSGKWWQPDPNSGGWLFWNGTSWVSGVPQYQTSPPSQYIPPSPPTVGPVSQTSPIQDQKKLMDMQTFREISRTQPWHKRPQKWWDLFSILVGAGTAIVWLMYSGLPKSSEGFDIISALLMVGIPYVLVTYRTEIDNYLVPLQPQRKRLPNLVLLGMGIAVPFLTAFILFNILAIRNYPLMYWNMLIGTAASYAIMREPVLAKGYQPGPRPNIKVPLFILLLCFVIVRIVRADHCLQDPLNAQDCARSSGYGEAMSGSASAVVAAGINGPTLFEKLAAEAGREGPVNRLGAPPITDQQYPSELEEERITQTQINSLKTALDIIILQKLEEGYRVSNPTMWQQALMELPGLGQSFMENYIEDMYGERTSRGTDVYYRPGHCQECQVWGVEWTQDLVKKIFGNDTITESLVINADSYFNHVANQITLPNGNRYIIDIWQSLQDGKAQIYKEEDWIRKWKEKLGDQAPVVRNLNESSLEDDIKNHGVTEGIAIFKHRMKDSPLANITVKSFLKNPWIEPIFKPNPKDMEVPDLSKGPSLGGKRW